MTYAGYQRYETPNLGAVAVEQIDKQKAFDLKQQELDEARKYKQATLDAKAKEDADKVAAAKAKQDEENAKSISTGQLASSKMLGEGAVTGYNSFDAAIGGMAPQIKTIYTNSNDKVQSGEWTMSQASAVDAGVQGAIKDMNNVRQSASEVNKAVNEPGASSSVKFLSNTYMSRANPGDDYNIGFQLDVDDNQNVTANVHSYKKGADGKELDAVVMPVSNFKKIASLSSVKPVDLNTSIYGVVDKIEITPEEHINKKTGVKTIITNLANQENYQRIKKTGIQSVLNQPIPAADYYMELFSDDPESHIVQIMADTTDQEKEQIAAQHGTTVDKMDFIEYKSNKKGELELPVLNGKQKEKLKTELGQRWDDYAAKRTETTMPHVTTVNNKIEIEKKVDEQTNQKYVKLYEGNRGALNQVRSEIAAANGMASSAKPKWDGKDREWLEWDADGKGLILWTNTSKDKMNENWQWDHILLEGDEAWPDPTAHIADKINQAKESANARAAGGATPKPYSDQ